LCVFDFARTFVISANYVFVLLILYFTCGAYMLKAEIEQLTVYLDKSNRAYWLRQWKS